MKRFPWVALVVSAACAGNRQPPPPDTARVEAVLPKAPAGDLAPSMARHPGGASGNAISDVDTCASCHTDVAEMWRKSAHAFASFNNPVYRVVVEKLRKDRGDKTSHFCGGCHDVALLVDGAMMQAIEPTDLRAHAGITCAACHSISGARADGNASWDLDTSPIPLPKEGDADSVVRHKARVGQSALRTAAMCSSCHKAFLDRDTGNAAHLTGQDDATPWSRSAFAGTHTARVDDAVADKDCRACHMPRVPAVLGDPGAKNGTVASHVFMGGHTWLAAMQNDPELVEKTRAFLANRVALDVAGLRHGDGRHEIVASNAIVLTPGEDAVVDLAIRNLDVGHRFPGGVMDAQDTWLEVTIDDARGRRVAEAGTRHEQSGADPTAHTLSSYMADGSGARLLVRETHEFRAGVWNHTIPPRDAAVVGYGFVAPEDPAAYPLAVTARLRHRSRNLPLQRAACEDARSPRGRSFGDVGLKKVARAIDPCRAQPVTDLARAEARLSGSRPVAANPAPSDEDSFARRYAYGLGLSHALQEKLDDARLPLAAALELAKTPRQRAIVLGALAYVAAHEGRTEETFALADRADAAGREAGMSDAELSATARARGEVLASTWRLADAAPFFFSAAQKNPRDDDAWARASVTLAGAGDLRAALDASKRGLETQPRDADMLRVQAIALASLRAETRDAEAAFLERRTPDEAPSIRGKCSAKVPGCANERVPVHVHAMRVR